MGFTAFDLDDIAKINDALLEFEGEDDLEEELEEDDLDGTVASHVKMVNLYLDQQSEPRFRAMCDKIMAANNLESITDAVVLAVENEHKNL
jgi:DNA-dependent RNA polymerase auxiliary subunit epsilon